MAPGGHRELLQLLGIGGGGHAEVSAERLERLYREVAPQILDGPAIENQLSLLNFLPTGCDGIDDLLGGGLRQGQVTELTGEAGTGKTQLCMSAAASAAALGHRVVYVDTSGSFSAARVKAFHRGFVTADAAPAEVEQHLRLTLGLITVVRVHDVLALFKVLEELGLGAGGRAGMPGDGGLEGRADLAAVGEQMGLLVVDSLSSLLSPLITRTHHQGYTVGFFERNSIPGRPSAFPASPPTTRRLIHPLSSTQAFVLVYFACGRCYLAVMASVASLLRSLAPVHNCAVMYTNHTVSAGNSGGGGGRGASIKPALGIRWTSTPHRRLCLSRNSAGAGSQCLAEIIYGPGTGVRTVFQVVGDGIRTLDGQAP